MKGKLHIVQFFNPAMPHSSGMNWTKCGLHTYGLRTVNKHAGQFYDRDSLKTVKAEYVCGNCKRAK